MGIDPERKPPPIFDKNSRIALLVGLAVFVLYFPIARLTQRAPIQPSLPQIEPRPDVRERVEQITIEGRSYQTRTVLFLGADPRVVVDISAVR